MPGVVEQWHPMSERSDDEQELVELLLNGSLTPREFERARTALGDTGATSINTDSGRSAAESVGVSAASPATARPSITVVGSSDGHTYGDTVSTSPDGPASPRLRPYIPRPMWIVGGSLAAILLVAMVAALAVSATTGETVELRAGQVVTRSEVHVPFWSGKSTELELVTYVPQVGGGLRSNFSRAGSAALVGAEGDVEQVEELAL